MSCKPTYKGKRYNSLEELKSSVITPQQKQQAIQLYSQYLDSIFPDSKVKDIVYLGGKQDIEGFKNFVTQPSTSVKGFKLSIDKKGKDQGKADLANRFIGYGVSGTSTYQYQQDAKKGGIPLNYEGVIDESTVAFVSVNGNNKASEKAIYETIENAREVLENGGTIIMDSTGDATRSWNQNGEALVQEGIGNPTGQTSKGYNYWGNNPENTSQPSTSVKPTQKEQIKLQEKLKTKLQALYPEIKLEYTNKPIEDSNDSDVFNQLIEDDYFEGNFIKYQDDVEKISNLILNKLKFKLKEFNGKYDESITTIDEYRDKVLNDLLKNIGINGVTSLSQLKDKLNSLELQTTLKEELQTAKIKKREYAEQLETYYSTRRLLNNFLKHFDINKYDSEQQVIIKTNLASLFKENKYKSDKQAIAFNKRRINSNEWANKAFKVDKLSIFFLGQHAKISKIETLINYFKIDKQDAVDRIYIVVENELNRREKFFTSEKTQSKINAKIVEDKIKSDNEKAEKLRRHNEELNKYKNSTVVYEVEGFLGGRNIHDLEAVLESSNINVELATIKNNGYTLDKTPEGKQSDLFVSILNLPEVNGNIEIAKKLKSLVYSEDFTNWFGDWLNNTEESSKIVDENGEPKLVYHGSGREFSNFEEKERGSTTGKWKDRLSDSEMSFMFTDSPNTAFYYAILERQEILKELTYYIRKTAQEPTNELIQEMYKKYPAIKNWVDSLKEKGLTKEEILKEFNRVYQEYNKLRDLSEGGAIGNMQANNEKTKQIIDYLEKNKETILKNGIPKNDKYNTAIIPGSDKNGYPVWLWSSKEYNTITVGNNGILNSFETKSLNGKNIKELSSSEYDLMVEDFKSNFVYNYQKIQEEIQAGGFRPKVYPVFLNAKKVNSKDFKNRPFNFQIGDTKEQVEKKETIGAQYEVADLIEEALNNNLDGSIIENIADPTVSTNYAIFRSNQIKSVFNKKDYTSQDNFYNQIRNEKIIGQANIKAMTVLVDAVNKKEDTLPHEYAHHYIAWFRNSPIVQEAIKKWGSEEALVQSIGEQVVKQEGEALNWWNNFVKWILDKFNNLSKLQKEELTQILTDAFLTRQDLKDTTTSQPSTQSSTSVDINDINELKIDFIIHERQEKLTKAKESAKPKIDEWQKKADGDIKRNGVISKPVSNALDALKGTLFNELESINETFDKELLDNNIPNAKEIIEKRKKIASIENSRKNNLLYPGSETSEEINTRYNAELAALEGTKPTETKPVTTELDKEVEENDKVCQVNNPKDAGKPATLGNKKFKDSDDSDWY